MAFYNGSFKKIIIYLRLLNQLESVVHWFLFFDHSLLILLQKKMLKLPMSYNQRKLENITCIYVLNLNLFIFLHIVQIWQKLY